VLFNSIEYAIFLPIVFLLYWRIKRELQLQNFFILLASYLFYGWWDWGFLFLIIFSSFIDFFIGKTLGVTQKESKRKFLLGLSLLVNLGLLVFFKYCNFFIESWVTAWEGLGVTQNLSTLNIILPVGISFYTFQTLSYTIDIYRRKLEPTKDAIAFFAFVSFFPQLVAGPIERASNLLPQFYSKRHFEYAKGTEGLRQILWGLFKKVVIADNCAIYVNEIFSNYQTLSGSELFLGAVYFAFQIYGDFSGYSDIAIGTAKLLGFDLMTNFKFPYFSRDIAEFWRRWHISLSTWFRDYLYIPLGGSRGSKWMNLRNVIIIFLVSGFWHGANWTFIFWGGLNGLLFIPLMLTGNNRKNLDVAGANSLLPSIKELLQIGLTFFMTCIAWIFFRATNITHAFDYISLMFSSSLFTFPSANRGMLPIIVLFLMVEWGFRKNETYSLEKIKIKPIRWGLYMLVIFLIFSYGPSKSSDFIYFQF